MQFRQSTLLLAVLLSVRTACAQTELQPYGPAAPDGLFNAPILSPNGIGESQQLDNDGIRAQLDSLEAQQLATQQELSRLRQQLGESPAATSTPPYPETPLSTEMLNASTPWPENDVCPPEKSSTPERLGTYYKDGFVLVDTTDPNKVPYKLVFNLFNQFRYLNQQFENSTFTDHLGNVRPVDERNDFNVNRNLFYFQGFVFDPNFIYNIIIWSSNSVATVVQGGYVGYKFDKSFTLFAGYYGIPGSRSNTRDFMFLQGVERSMADSFFRPAFTQAVWAEGQPFEHVWYSAWVGNSLNTLGVSSTQIDRNFVYAGSTWWEPLGDWGPPGAARMAYSDLEDHKCPVVRLGTSATRAREDRFSNLEQTLPENSAIFNSDGVLFFETGSLAPGVTVNLADYTMWAQDAGFKYRGLALNGQYFFRWLTDFNATGPLPISETFDHGYEASLGYFIVPKTFELYGRSSAVFGEFRDSSEYAFGFNWHPWHNRGFRIIGEANRVKFSPTSSIQTIYTAGSDGWNFILQTGLYF